MKIPIYRAKKINSDEYVIGFYVFSNIHRDTHLIRVDETYWEVTGLVYREVEIDPLTLSIHFPDMLDRKGNKIFASINKNGSGSSVVFARILLSGDKVYFIYEDYKIKAKLIKNNKKTNVKCNILKIIGIKE